jgi:hypothetical protein
MLLILIILLITFYFFIHQSVHRRNGPHTFREGVDENAFHF